MVEKERSLLLWKEKVVALNWRDENSAKISVRLYFIDSEEGGIRGGREGGWCSGPTRSAVEIPLMCLE